MKKIVVGAILGVVLLSIFWLLSLVLIIKSADNDPLSETAEYYQPAPTPGSDFDVIEADAEIKVPPSAREIHAMISGFRELDTWVRFELPANELALFLDGTLCESPLASVKSENYAPDELFDPDWWQPHTATELTSCTGWENEVRQHILVDRSDHQVFTIYVFTWTD